MNMMNSASARLLARQSFRVLAQPPVARPRSRWLCTGAPYAMFVTVKVAEGRESEFLRVLGADVLGTRLEPDCLRMDLLRDETEPLKYHFYMVIRARRENYMSAK